MTVPFYKSLDKEFEIFGLKGSWVKIFLMGAGVCLVLGLIVGAMTSSGIAVVTVLVLIIGDFLVCMMMQTRLPSRRVGKYSLASKCSGWVIRRESLGRILLEDPQYSQVKKILASRKDA